MKLRLLQNLNPSSRSLRIYLLEFILHYMYSVLPTGFRENDIRKIWEAREGMWFLIGIGGEVYREGGMIQGGWFFHSWPFSMSSTRVLCGFSHMCRPFLKKKTCIKHVQPRLALGNWYFNFRSLFKKCMQVHVNVRIIYVLCVDIVLCVFMCVYCGCKYQTLEQCHCEDMNTQNHIPCI